MNKREEFYIIYKNPIFRNNFNENLTHHIWNNGLIERSIYKNIPLKVYSVNGRAVISYSIFENGKLIAKEKLLNVNPIILEKLVKRIFKNYKITLNNENFTKFISEEGLFFGDKKLVGKILYENDNNIKSGYHLKVRKLDFGVIGKDYNEVINKIPKIISDFMSNKNNVFCSDCKQDFSREGMIEKLQNEGLSVNKLLEVPMNLNCPNCKSQNLKITQRTKRND